MPRSNMASFGAIALALGSLTSLCAADSADRVVTASAKAAKKAAKALDRHDTRQAIVAAEQAVALAPREAAYRLLLGRSYLQAGRFQSAGQAFDDTLQLDATNGRAALNLALTQIARDDRRAARSTLDAHIADIPTADRGLALALTGDTAGAVSVLTLIARSPEATPKARQNLALAYALAGEWSLARVVAAADMSPADVDARLGQWAAFVQPQAASDQVATLLGVRAVADGGQPDALALTTPVAPRSVDVAAVPAVTQAVPVPVPVAVAAIPAKPRIVFAAPKEVVQSLTSTMIAGTSTPYKTPAKVAAKPGGRAAARASAPARGTWYVQLGAYDNPRVAQDGWARARARYAAFKAYAPHRSDIRTAKATFHLLSVGGFTRAAAKDVCTAYRQHGGACFVRVFAGNQLAAWLAPENKQLASK